MNIYNYSQLVYLSENCILVTGGINDALNDISFEAYIWNPVNNTAKRLPSFLYFYLYIRHDIGKVYPYFTFFSGEIICYRWKIMGW